MKYKNYDDNVAYRDLLHGKFSYYNEMILFLLISKEINPNGYYSKIYMVKYVKDNCKSGLVETKHFFELLQDLNLIDSKFIATDLLYYIESSKDLINIIKNNINVNLYLRIKKIKKINTKLILK